MVIFPKQTLKNTSPRQGSPLSTGRALGGFDVATGLSREVDDNAACLHAIDVLLATEVARCRGMQRSGWWYV